MNWWVQIGMGIISALSVIFTFFIINFFKEHWYLKKANKVFDKIIENWQEHYKKLYSHELIKYERSTLSHSCSPDYTIIDREEIPEDKLEILNYFLDGLIFKCKLNPIEARTKTILDFWHFKLGLKGTFKFKKFQKRRIEFEEKLISLLEFERSIEKISTVRKKEVIHLGHYIDHCQETFDCLYSFNNTSFYKNIKSTFEKWGGYEEILKITNEILDKDVWNNWVDRREANRREAKNGQSYCSDDKKWRCFWTMVHELHTGYSFSIIFDRELNLAIKNIHGEEDMYRFPKKIEYETTWQSFIWGIKDFKETIERKMEEGK